MQKVFLYAGSVVVSGISKLFCLCHYGKINPVKGFITMKLTLLLIAAACLQAHSRGFAQNINLTLKNSSLETAFKEIEKQSGYRFVYTKEQLVNTKAVSAELRNSSIEHAVAVCLKDQPIEYSIKETYIIIKRKETKASFTKEAMRMLSGKVIDENGIAINGATVAIKGSSLATYSNEDGEWKLNVDEKSLVIVISSIGYQTREISIGQQSFYAVSLVRAINVLDEMLVIAYGTTTKRLNTGNVSKVKKEDIERQPVSNPLLGLHGRVPGLVVEQTSGLPGAEVNLLIRGRNSFRSGTAPLFIIDGVPFMINSGSLAQVGDPLAQNPFNSINPADIESIEVLKDADATAIYGSQAANGVVMITTKKGKTGKVNIDLNTYYGIGKITRSVDLLKTADYLTMRKEAFTNDNIVPTVSNAADLLVWDSTAYTDWKKVLIGKTAKVLNTQLTMTGGNEQTQFLLSSSYYRGQTVFVRNDPETRGSVRLNVSHSSRNKKFSAALNSAYSNYIKRLPFNDLTSYIFLPPNTPAYYDPTGNINWNNWVTGVDNPMAQLLQEYRSETDNLLSQLSIQYRVSKRLSVTTQFGYGYTDLGEERIQPIKALRPSATTTGTLNLGSGKQKNWLFEPQTHYKIIYGQSTVEGLAGLSFQDRKQTGQRITGSQYTTDELIRSIASAGQLAAINSKTQYRYFAAFGRLNYLYKQRYRLNVNFRRDGSSRFAPENRFANFWAVGGAWILSEEKFLKKGKLVSFLKVRSSYGVTGNDQIGDYQYMDSWSSASNYVYQGATGVLPDNLFNKDLQWERNRKLEVGLEAGFLKDKISASLSWYRNRSDNLLVYYNLPYQTGFSSILKNFDALVENSGFEIELNSVVLQRGHTKWNAGFNVSIPSNKLVSYPGIELSGDRYVYKVGEPLRIQFGYEYKGINPAIGVYEFTDANNDNLINSNDLLPVGARNIKFFGGLSNGFTIKNFAVDIFFHFVKQDGRSYLSSLGSRPGTMSNQPVYILDRWQKPGDVTAIQKFTSGTGSAAYTAYGNYRTSSALITDASFVRLKNLSVSYSVPFNDRIKKTFKQVRIYAQAQNVFTITKYKGADPESQTLYSLPPLRMFTGGIQFNF